MDLPPLDPLYWALGVTALVAALGFRPWRPQVGKLSIRLTSAVLLPAALMAGWYGITGEVLPVPPAEAKDWIPWCALGAALIGVTEVRAMNALGVGILVGAVMGHGLERVIAYPTLLFIDAEGAVQATYTGFTGPAAPAQHEALKAHLEALVQELAEPQ